jgi:hypothetical protein
MFFLPGWHHFFSDFFNGRTDGNLLQLRGILPILRNRSWVARFCSCIFELGAKLLLENWVAPSKNLDEDG